jgi:hypothetical protein
VGWQERAYQSTAHDRVLTELHTPGGAAIRRLGKDRPDLLELVVTKKLSAHAAMIEAGFRKPTITLPTDPKKAVACILRHFHGKQLETLVRCLKAAAQNT